MLPQRFSCGANTATYWTIERVASNMLGLFMKRHGMSVSGSVVTISTSITTGSTANQSQRIHFLFHFSLKGSLAWIKIYFYSVCTKASTETSIIICKTWEVSGLWGRYLCTLSAFLVEQHFLHISQMVPMSKCLDSMCWMTLCFILLINPHSRQSQSPDRVLCILRPTKHSRRRPWLNPLSPKTRQSRLYFWKSVGSRFVN